MSASGIQSDDLTKHLLNFASNILNNIIAVLGNSRLSLVGWLFGHAVPGNPVMAISLVRLSLSFQM